MNGPLGGVIRHLRSVALVQDGAGLTDGQLLECYLAQRDDSAFAALVRRHGPMVLGVCRRVLCDAHDAEDAFQATFLVLVRKAASVLPREMVGNFLYGVAYRTAQEARKANARRRAKEKEVADVPERQVTEDVWRELQPLLDQELSRLPDHYRVPIVLCDLEGKTHKDAARQLGWPQGTLSSRLVRGRHMLARRLTRQGLALSSGALGVVFAQNAASACVPSSLVVSTLNAATLVAAGQAVTGVISAKVAALTEGVLKAMLLTKLKTATVVLLALSVLGAGATIFTHRALAQKPAEQAAKDKPKEEGKKETPEVSGVVKTLDAAKGSLTIQLGKPLSGEKIFTLAKDAKIFLDDGTGDRLGFQEGKLADLTEQAVVTVRLSEDQKEVVRIWVEGPTIQGTLKAVDKANNTLTATVAVTKGEPAVDKTFTVAKNVKLFVDDGKVKDKSKPPKEDDPSLADLPANTIVFLRLSADRKVVGSIRAEGQTIAGVVKAVDADKNTITLSVDVPKGEPKPDKDKTFALAKNAQISVDDGKAKDKSKPNPYTLADVPAGARVTLRLTLDHQEVVAIRAEGATIYGPVKEVDAAKSTITVGDKVKGDQTYRVSKEAAIYLDEKSDPKKLADVPVGSDVNLKLLVDQKTVFEIRAIGPTVHGVVRGNAGNDSITIGDKQGDKTYAVLKGANVRIADGKQGKLADLIDGTVASLRLSADRATVLDIHAEGPSFRGIVKFVDTDKKVITLTIGGKNGVGGEDRTFEMAKNIVVRTDINGAPLKLADLKTEKEVILRLAIDQKAAERITLLGE
jgi:RNA polymerase sigma factor (sigma-70 family)